MTTITGHQITRLAGGRVTASAQINLNNQSHRVSFIVPGESVYEGIEPFLTLALVPAMTVSQPIELDNPVSPRLLANIANIQNIFQNWDEQFHRIPVKAPALKSAGKASKSNWPGRISARITSMARQLNKKAWKRPFNSSQNKTKYERKVACFFSGGVDSFYTLLKHIDEIDTVIFVSAGFDIFPHPNNEGVRRMIRDRLRGVARQMGKNFLDVETHVQNFSDQYVSWFWYHGSAMAALAQLLSNRFHKVYFASSYAYNDLSACGSNLLLDPLWSTEKLEIVYDGAEIRRSAKILQVAKSEIALNNLRVCGNYGENREYNCGECEKCMRTMAGLRFHGVVNYSAFARPLDLEALVRLSMSSQPLQIWKNMINRLDSSGSDPELLQAIQKMVANNESAESEEEIAILEKEFARQENRYRLQNDWARGMEADNIRLARQIEAAIQWGRSLEKELLAQGRKQK